MWTTSFKTTTKREKGSLSCELDTSKELKPLCAQPKNYVFAAAMLLQHQKYQNQ